MATATMRVPTIFTAVDRFSDVVSRMTAGTTKFSKTASSAVMRVDNKVNGLWNSMNSMSQMAIGGGLGGLFYYAGKDIMEYEKKLASLGAVTGTKVGAMNKQIESLGNETKRSVIDIAGAFEIVGSKMSQYLKEPEALKSITNASVTMANAARMELEPAINSLTGVMNIYRMSAEDASRVVNKLSAGETVGSISISQTADILTQFGAQAVRANVPIEESIALIQTLVKSMGVEGVGRGLRNILFDISSTKTWDKNRWKAIKMAGVDFEFVTNNANDLTKRLRELKKLTETKGAMELFFKRTGTVAANTLFQNFDKQGFTDFLGQIKALNDAQDKATKNTSTLSYSIDRLKDAFTNFMVTGNSANATLRITKSLIGWMTDNMGGLINSIGLVVTAFLGWKAIVVWMTIYNKVMKAHLIITQIAALRNIAYAETLGLVAAAQWAAYWPALLVLGALGLLAYAFWDTGKATDSMVNGQIASLSKGDQAMINSTNVMATELDKQKKLLERPKVPVLLQTPESALRDKIVKEEEERKKIAAYRARVEAHRLQVNAAKNELLQLQGKNATGIMARSQIEQLRNIPEAMLLQSKGMTFEQIEKVYPNLETLQERKQRLEIIIRDKGGNVEEAKLDGKPYGAGLPVYTSSTKK